VLAPQPFSHGQASRFAGTNLLQAAFGWAPSWAPLPAAAVEAAEAAALEALSSAAAAATAPDGGADSNCPPAAAGGGADAKAGAVAAAEAALPPPGEGFVPCVWPAAAVSYLMVPIRRRDLGGGSSMGSGDDDHDVRDDPVLSAALRPPYAAPPAAGGAAGAPTGRGSQGRGQAGGGERVQGGQVGEDEEEDECPYAIDWLFLRELAVGPLPAPLFVRALAGLTNSGGDGDGRQRGRARRRLVVDALWPAARALAEGPPLVGPAECAAACAVGAAGLAACEVLRAGVVAELRQRVVISQHRGQVGEQ
jgi:hypothetical protein